MVCIPSVTGVVELGSTELIFQNSDLMTKVRVLFNFNSIELGSWSMQINPDENDPSTLYITDPSSIEIRETVNTTTPVSISPNNHQSSKQIAFENPNSISCQQTQQQQTHSQSFFARELNFTEFDRDGSSIRNGNSNSCKPESGEILNFGESKRSSCSPNENIFSGNSQFGSAEDNNSKKKTSPTSRGSNEEGMLSFTSGVILPSSGTVLIWVTQLVKSEEKVFIGWVLGVLGFLRNIDLEIKIWNLQRLTGLCHTGICRVSPCNGDYSCQKNEVMESNLPHEVDHFSKNRGQDDAAYMEVDDNGDEVEGDKFAEGDDEDDVEKSAERSINGNHTVEGLSDDVDGVWNSAFKDKQ
ncbi:Transcription factor MYC2 [Camellia lanceoleosa]|uniref:Transcription factor MYC2 n=1 Tax=Camellia lanceoleosa TaxID=1840588 RepID=A0ACC0FRE3_9ERIC|nr:Transcription factor MYC2 [Camellia lanceoleosa]